MSLTARLHIEGHSNEDQGIQVIACDFKIEQPYTQQGQASGRIIGGIINATIRGLEDEELFSWVVSQNEIKNGSITFSGVTSTGPARRIEFRDAFLVGYHETFSNESDIVIHLIISARELVLHGVNVTNSWTLASD